MKDVKCHVMEEANDEIKLLGASLCCCDTKFSVFCSPSEMDSNVFFSIFSERCFLTNLTELLAAKKLRYITKSFFRKSP